GELRYETLRIPRTAALQQGARANAEMLHMPDGPQQRARDQAMRRGSALEAQAGLFSYDPGRTSSESLAEM
ncbi:hypothetical protein ACFQZ2_14595, partial [Streptomonospora algeriensis]